MKPRSVIAIFLSSLAASSLALVACVGDSPVVQTGQDASANDAVANNDASGSDQSNPPVDAGPDAPPPCGAAGEACCVAPLVPCGDGMACSTDTKKCLVNDVWAVGEYKTYAPNNGGFVTLIVTAHYDGAAWTRGKDVLTDNALSAAYPVKIYQSGTSVRVLTNKSPNGTMWQWNGVAWQECKLGNSCVGPTPTGYYWALTSVSNGGNSDYWLAGSNQMYRCASGSSSCVSVMTGIPSNSVGTGNFAGETSQDLWYTVLDHVIHYDGTQWSSMAVADAEAIGMAAPNDMWIGYKLLRHWDGKVWSNGYQIDGTATPGLIFEIAAPSSKDVWAVGNDTSASFAAHWNGTDWKKTTIPAMNSTESVYAPSAVDAFIVGSKPTATNTGVIAHWDGTKWTEMPSPTITYPQEQQTGTLKWVGISGAARPRR